MNDRYLFRSKRIDNGEWVEGYLFDDGFENGRMFVGGLVIEEYHGTACDDWSITGINFYEVDQSTICQCTGLNDKNGQKIWENDVVKQFADCNELGNNLYFFYQIRWNNEYSAFEGYEIYAKETVLFPDLEDIEVIGNIFDNPELINE